MAATSTSFIPTREIQKLLTRVWGPTELPFKVAIFSDFDGTISDIDSLKFILNKFGKSEWLQIEKDLSSGALSERKGLQKAFDYLPLPFKRAKEEVLKKVSIDPAFKDFAEWVQFEGHSLSILSGGFKKLIEPLLKREGLSDVRLLANDVRVEKKAWKVLPCQVERLCEECNHCKSASLFEELKKDPQTFIVYIGDGHTDACPIQLADLVFAKGFLKNYCEEKGIGYVAFDTFLDVERELRWRLRALHRQWMRIDALQKRRELIEQREFLLSNDTLYEVFLKRLNELRRDALSLRRESIIKRCELKLGWAARQFLTRSASKAA